MPMPLNPSVAEALDRQVNNELMASHIYLAMAAYFDAKELPGFAARFRAHAGERTGHAMRLYDFLVKRDAQVALTGIDQPATDDDSPEAAVGAALAMESDVTGQINDLFDLAHGNKGYGASRCCTGSWRNR